jgi:hypothetical protein
MISSLKPNCPDCGAAIGERHRAGCELGCLHFDPNDARRQAWSCWCHLPATRRDISKSPLRLRIEF